MAPSAAALLLLLPAHCLAFRAKPVQCMLPPCNSRPSKLVYLGPNSGSDLLYEFRYPDRMRLWRINRSPRQGCDVITYPPLLEQTVQESDVYEITNLKGGRVLGHQKFTGKWYIANTIPTKKKANITFPGENLANGIWDDMKDHSFTYIENDHVLSFDPRDGSYATHWLDRDVVATRTGDPLGLSGRQRRQLLSGRWPQLAGHDLGFLPISQQQSLLDFDTETGAFELWGFNDAVNPCRDSGGYTCANKTKNPITGLLASRSLLPDTQRLAAAGDNRILDVNFETGELLVVGASFQPGDIGVSFDVIAKQTLHEIPTECHLYPTEDICRRTHACGWCGNTKGGGSCVRGDKIGACLGTCDTWGWGPVLKKKPKPTPKPRITPVVDPPPPGSATIPPTPSPTATPTPTPTPEPPDPPPTPKPPLKPVLRLPDPAAPLLPENANPKPQQDMVEYMGTKANSTDRPSDRVDMILAPFSNPEADSAALNYEFGHPLDKVSRLAPGGKLGWGGVGWGGKYDRHSWGEGVNLKVKNDDNNIFSADMPEDPFPGPFQGQLQAEQASN